MIASQEMRLARRSSRSAWANPLPGAPGYSFEIRPYPYHSRKILDALEAERRIRGMYRKPHRCRHRHGQDGISALDYRAICQSPPERSLSASVCCASEEILKQSLDCFRGVLKDPNFGRPFCGGHRPEGLDHLFVSIQMFHAQDLTSRTNTDFYDYIVVDEFHHAAAPTYEKLPLLLSPPHPIGAHRHAGAHGRKRTCWAGLVIACGRNSPPGGH
jgi:hypothetical protein